MSELIPLNEVSVASNEDITFGRTEMIIASLSTAAMLGAYGSEVFHETTEAYALAGISAAGFVALAYRVFRNPSADPAARTEPQI